MTTLSTILHSLRRSAKVVRLLSASFTFNALTTHMRVKPYCQVCGNTFNALTTHMRVKPYCQVCGNTFNALSCYPALFVMDVTIVQQLCCTYCCHIKIHTWNHTTGKYIVWVLSSLWQHFHFNNTHEPYCQVCGNTFNAHMEPPYREDLLHRL